MSGLSHADVCKIACRYLKNHLNCGIIFSEVLPFGNKESPDAIGFRPDGLSILMEAKISREDFLSDKYKPFRKNPDIGMGDYRFYVCPEGVIKPEDLPPKWGLFYTTKRGSLKAIKAPKQLTQLQAAEQFIKYETYCIEKGGNIPHWFKCRCDDMLPFLFINKNMTAEINILYSGYRKLCLSGKVTEIFESPL